MLIALIIPPFSPSVLAQMPGAKTDVQTETKTGTKTEGLFQVIRSGNSDELERMLSNGADANDSLKGYSALMATALNGSAEQMKILIDHGANINYADKNGITALWLAVPDWNKTHLLLDHGANPKLLSKEGYSVLVKLAAMPGTIKIFQLLIDKGADPQKSAPDNYLLYNAASSGDTAILGLLIRSGLSVNDTVSFGDYPIDAALSFRTFATVKMLVDNGARVNIRPMSFQLDAFNGFTPLMFAAISNDKPSFLYLLDHGADPNIKTKRGYTVLMLLQQAETDDPEMTLALINHGAVVSARAPDGTDALYYAIKKGNTPSALLLKKNQDR
jgi:ankyrin repeat protein